MSRDFDGGKQALIMIAACFGLISATHAVCLADETLAAVDTYGLISVRREAILAAAGLRAGSPVPTDGEIKGIKLNLERIPAVCEADVSVIRVHMSGESPGTPALPTVYIGIRESGSPKIIYRSAPTGKVALPEELFTTYCKFERSKKQAFQRGDNGEDYSAGYALSCDQATRAIQQQLIVLAKQHFEHLVEVLREAESAEQRRIAAVMLAFAADKTRIAAELAAAARDPDSHVRNNTLRALGVILDYANRHPELKIEVPIDPYVELLDSVKWTDRNKAMFVLLELTESRDESILTRMATKSLPALAEMARWNTEVHALMAYYLLGRAARIPEIELSDGWRAGKREAILARALKYTTNVKLPAE